MDSINIAVIGFGLIGKKHASIIRSHKKLKLCGIVENYKKPLNDKDLKLKFFHSIEELLKNEKVDGAIISTPTLLHAEQSRKFIEKKNPYFN